MLLQNQGGKATARSQIKQIIIAGAGFFADAYDLFVIDLALAILDVTRPEAMTSWDKSLMGSASLSGAVVGQLLFGILGDWFGRRNTFIATCLLIMIGCTGAALSTDVEINGKVVCSFSKLFAFFRFILGLGIGGEYPLAATITMESASVAAKSTMIAAVFSMQGWGVLLSAALTTALLHFSDFLPLEFVWRIAIGFGAIPTACVILFRAQMVETPAYVEAAAAGTRGPNAEG